MLDFSQRIIIIKGNGDIKKKANIQDKFYDDIETHIYYHDERNYSSKEEFNNIFANMKRCLKQYATSDYLRKEEYNTSCMIGNVLHFDCCKNPVDDIDEWEWSDEYLLNVLKIKKISI